MVARPETGSIPDAPGSYQFLDAEGRVIYVGKAKSLRSRLSNYFAPPATLPERTYQMVQTADHVEWIVAKNEVEAFFLEFNLIKRHKPRFNIRLKDDKSYPYLAVTLDEEWPRAMVMRGQHRKGVRYFGPFAHAYAIRETLDLLLRTFPIRTCTNSKFDRHHRLGRPCLYAHIEKCAAPCVGDIDHDEYMKLVQELIDFLDGEHDAVIERLEQRMHEASDTLEFELAARHPRSAHERSQGHRTPADGRHARGGLRPHRPRRGSARSERAALLRAQGPRGRAQGPDRRQGGRRRDARARSRASSSSSTPTRPRPTSRRRSSFPSSPRTSISTRSSSR